MTSKSSKGAFIASKESVPVSTERLKIECGFIGRIIGTGKNAFTNIIGLAVLILAAITLYFIATNNSKMLISTITPTAITTLGFAFGYYVGSISNEK